MARGDRSGPDSEPPPSEKIGLDESEWRNDPESLAEWDAWVTSFEPLEFTPEEEALMTEFAARMREYNIEAARRQTRAGIDE